MKLIKTAPPQVSHQNKLSIFKSQQVVAAEVLGLAGVLIFLSLAILIQADVPAVDQALNQWAYRFTFEHSWSAVVWRFITDIGAPRFWHFSGALIVFILGLRRQIWLAFYVALVTVGNGLLGNLLKRVFSRERPDSEGIIVEAQGYSFPSGHSNAAAAGCALVVLVMYPLIRKQFRSLLLIAAVSVATLIGLSRIALGVHYPTDVLAGWCLGLTVTTLLFLIAMLLPAARREFSARFRW